MDVAYDINSPRALNLGYQYDHNVRTVTFTGFTPVDDTNTIYLKFERLGIYPLSNMSFEVSQTFTFKCGTFKGQLLELASDNSLVQNSNVFKMMVKPSVREYDEIVTEDPSISLWFTEMSDLYNEVLDAYEGGMLVTVDSITSALGYTPANAENIPSELSELTNDVGFITGVSSEDICDALGYVPANTSDVPSKTSDILNDSGFITGITGQDINNALGYTPADSDSVPVNTSDLTNDSGFITGITAGDISAALGYVPADEENVVVTITSEDVTNALGYTPADINDVPDVPSNVSSFVNDSGYITEVKPEDVLSALGYTPADSNLGNYKPVNKITLDGAASSIEISTDLDGNHFELDGAVVAISNSNGIKGGTNSYIYAYDAAENLVGGMRVFFYGGSSVIKAVVKLEISGDIVEMSSIGWTNAAPYSPVNKSLMNDIGDAGRISKFVIVGNGQSFNQGTEIEVLGYKTSDNSNDGDYSLFKTISLNTNTESVIVTAGDNGDALDTTGFAVIIDNTSGIGGGTNGYIYAYDANDNVVGQQIFFAGGQSITRSTVMVKINGDLVEIDSIGWNSNTPYSPNIKSIMSTVADTGNIAKIEITGNGSPMNSGTTIRIYGV